MFSFFLYFIITMTAGIFLLPFSGRWHTAGRNFQQLIDIWLKMQKKQHVPSRFKQLIGMRVLRGQGSAAITGSAWSAMSHWEDKDRINRGETWCQDGVTSLFMFKTRRHLKRVNDININTFSIKQGKVPFYYPYWYGNALKCARDALF